MQKFPDIKVVFNCNFIMLLIKSPGRISMLNNFFVKHLVIRMFFSCFRIWQDCWKYSHYIGLCCLCLLPRLFSLTNGCWSYQRLLICCRICFLTHLTPHNCLRKRKVVIYRKYFDRMILIIWYFYCFKEFLAACSRCVSIKKNVKLKMSGL